MFVLFSYVCSSYLFARITVKSIFEMKIEDRLLISITKITCPNENFGGFLYKNVFKLGNKITIMKNIKDVHITFDVSGN